MVAGRERSFHSGWRPVWLALAVFAAGVGLNRLHTPRLLWGGLWALFFLYVGSYCIRNFIACRETHCAITGPGWILVGVAAGLGSLSVLRIPDWGFTWLAYVAVAGLGFGLQRLVGPTLRGRGP
ncbi:MAG: hypothetical protein ACR2MZ_09255 [Candidatus Dormibacter sp.]|uniref:hypothetical protein n=1 Tax=Candidatus Dormibacter sp. TaxID=2973982 RepID=UPI003D9AB9ED